MTAKTAKTTKTAIAVNPVLKVSNVRCANIPLRAFALIHTNGLGKQATGINQVLGQYGNNKIPSTTAIFNMSSATDCPSKRLGLCKAIKQGVKCYALKSEYEYRPLVLPYRRKQEAYWKSITANQFASSFLLLNALKLSPFTALRFNEAGDFHSQDCVNKAEAIATILKRFGITCYCYTSRNDLDFNKVKNLIISGSGFTKKGISGQFVIRKNVKDRPKGFGVCAGNCKICNRCLIRGRNTVVKAH